MDENVDGQMGSQEAGGSVSEQIDPAKPSRVMRILPPSPKRSKRQQELDELEARLETRIQTEVERRFSSAKDKRWAEVERQYGRLSELSKPGGEAVQEETQSSAEPQLARRILAQAGLEDDPEALQMLKRGANGDQVDALRMVADIAQLAVRRREKPPTKAGAVIQPSGGGMPTPDLRAEYEKRLRALRPGDVASVSDLKREFRKKGLNVY